MDYSEHDPGFVRCLRCYKILKCSRYDTSTLLEHVRSTHPDMEGRESNTKSLKPYQGNCSKNPDENADCKSMNKSEQDCKEAQCKDSKLNRRTISNPALKSPRKRALYRTSVERWRPANGSIYCPSCGTKTKPLIKTMTEHLSTNSCGAAFILGCWPCCFLPCWCPTEDKEFLHCAKCKAFLGLYDRESNCIRPNREFVEEMT